MKIVIGNLIFAIIMGTTTPALTQAQTLDLTVSHTIKTNGNSPNCVGPQSAGTPCPAFVPKCMNVTGPKNVGTPVAQVDCLGTLNQYFWIVDTNATSAFPDSPSVVQIQYAADKTKCVGVNVVLNPKWHRPGSVQYFVNPATQLELRPCLSDSGVEEAGTKWLIDKTRRNPMTFKASGTAEDGSSSCLDVPKGAVNNYLRLQISTCNGGINQRWTISN